VSDILSDFNQTWIYRHIFIKGLNIKCHKNRPVGTAHRRTGMKLIAASRDNAEAPKQELSSETILSVCERERRRAVRTCGVLKCV